MPQRTLTQARQLLDENEGLLSPPQWREWNGELQDAVKAANAAAMRYFNTQYNDALGACQETGQGLCEVRDGARARHRPTPWSRQIEPPARPAMRRPRLIPKTTNRRRPVLGHDTVESTSMKKYDVHMSVERITVSLETELASAVRDAADADAQNVSSWLADAARRQLAARGLREVVAAWEAEHGAFDDAELAAVRARVEA